MLNQIDSYSTHAIYINILSSNLLDVLSLLVIEMVFTPSY